METDKRLPEFSDVQINFEAYKEMEREGMFAVFVAEEGEELKGYLAMYIIETPHIIGYRQAISDALYVDQTARKEGAAQKLITMAEDYAKEMSCSYMTLCFKADNPHTKFCNSIGYSEDDIMYSKSLDV